MMIASSRVFAACVAGGTAFLALSPTARAQNVTASVETAISGGYSKNPYNTTSNGESSFVEGRVSPNIRVFSDRDSFSLTGQVRLQHYFSQVRDNKTFNVNGDYRHKLNPYTSLGAGGSVSITRNTLENLLDDLDDGTPPETGEDLNVIGSTIKRYRGHASGSFVVSSRASFSISGSANATRYGADNLRGYNSVSASAGFSRRLSEHASGGLYASVSDSRYRDPVRPDSTVVSGGLSGSLQTSSQWNLNGRIGVSKVEYHGEGFGSATSLVGSLSMCRKGEHDSICGTASREYLPSGFLGTVPQTRLSLSYSRNVGEFDDISGSVGFVSSGRGARSGSMSRSSTEFLRSQVEYSHGFTSRLRLHVSAFYRKVLNQAIDRPGDYGARLGLSYRFGDSL